MRQYNVTRLFEEIRSPKQVLYYHMVMQEGEDPDRLAEIEDVKRGHIKYQVEEVVSQLDGDPREECPWVVKR